MSPGMLRRDISHLFIIIIIIIITGKLHSQTENYVTLTYFSIL